jgi:asparagine N-glycosylation enzyme membrane subunit Stt3
MISPQFFDIFGIFTFVFIIVMSIELLFEKKKPEKIFLVILLVIGILGFIVDGIIVLLNYILPRI